MRVAVAGAGALAKLISEELPAAGHEVVVLTRSHRAFFDGKPGVVEQRVTDYSSVPQLAEQLNDCDALICTIVDLTPVFVNVHTALIEACKLTPKCKRFIPSEFNINTEDFPEPSGSTYYHNRVVREALTAQTELEWTVVSLGWIMEYIVPSANRYQVDIGPLYPLDFHTKTITIPGSGNDTFTTTSARDTIKAVAELLKSPRKWRHFTYVQGEETTWLKVVEALKTVGGMSDLKVEFESVNELQQIYEQKETVEAMVAAEFKLFVPTGKTKFDQDKVQRDRDEYFSSLRFRTIEDLLKAFKNDPQAIV